MRRLGILNNHERHIVDMAGSCHYKYGADAYQVWCDTVTYDSYAHEYPELFSFLKKILKIDRYFDLHSGNVMIDEEENYRLVDIEGFIRTPLELRCNDWILR
jgi:hypothetical protein